MSSRPRSATCTCVVLAGLSPCQGEREADQHQLTAATSVDGLESRSCRSLGLPCSVCRLAPGALVVPSIIDRKFSAVGRGEGEDAAAFGDGSAGAGTSGSFSFTIRAEFSNLSCSELSVSLPISDLRDVFSAVRDSTCVASSSVSTCFLSLDRLADSLFDCFLFSRFSSLSSLIDKSAGPPV